MYQQPNRTSIARLVLVTLVVLLLGACSDTGSSTPTPAPTNLAAPAELDRQAYHRGPHNGQTISR